MRKNSWKVADIAGFEVLEKNGEKLGVLVDVLPTAANDVLVIKSEIADTPEILIPALMSVVLEVNPEKKIIIVDLPPGLKDIYKTGK